MTSTLGVGRLLRDLLVVDLAQILGEELYLRGACEVRAGSR